MIGLAAILPQNLREVISSEGQRYAVFPLRLRGGLGENISYPILSLPQVEQQKCRDQHHCSRYYQPQSKDPMVSIPHLVNLTFSGVCFGVLFRPHRITLEALVKQECWGGFFLF